ncbi:biliverdin-producing heme oxygenase [Marinobacter fonticola]|uniref:biliverdin-producing heme oxygenase n=1 Tax=Marinobacter fonticola TaxID=2603215 RepID=UPI0011E66D8C|nr:biliverdin-producing heme oxygenase [Marinobacter fonticola]
MQTMETRPAPQATRANPLLTQLRSATLKSHRQIERNPRLARLFEPGLSHSRYRDLLARLLGFYEPVEFILADLPSRIAVADRSVVERATAERWKTPWLRQDLSVLGLSEQAIAELPRASVAETPQIEDLPQAVGCLYVLEGATMGGTLISRHLHATLGVTPETGGRFYDGYGPGNGRMWGCFRQQLANLEMGAPQTLKMTSSAIETFSCLDHWLISKE